MITIIKKCRTVGVVVVSLCVLSPIASYASSSPTPSATHAKRQPLTGNYSRSPLTQSQKAAVAAEFASARMAALNGYQRAIADAKAIRDQSIADAGSNKSAIKIAERTFRDFKKSILADYKSAIGAAKLARRKALEAAHVPIGTE